MKNKLFVTFFSSGLQAISVQIIGILFFYYTSVLLSKDDFGIISWANAVSVFVTTLLSMGLEQIVIRRVASSRYSDWAAAAFFLHSIFTSLVAVGVIVILANISHNAVYGYLLLFFVAQAIMYVGSPLKQLLNARENFLPYGVIAFISNLLKLIFAVIVYRYNFLSVRSVAYILIVSACIETVSLLLYIQLKAPLHLKFKKKAYLKLIRESFPQYMAGLFDSSLSRMDWILLGILSTNIATASYSFAYRAFEVAKLPLTIIAPIIMVRLARMAQQNSNLDEEKTGQINQILQVELFLSVFIFLVLNIAWGPVVTQLTHGKYGDSNANQFLFLSACIPLQFFINLLWTLAFTNKLYKKVLYVTAVSASLNVFLNFMLIGKFAGLGSAIAYFATNIVQGIMYLFIIRKSVTKINMTPLVIFFGIAVCGYMAAKYSSNTVFIELVIAMIFYVAVSVLTGQINKKQLSLIKSYLGK